MLQRILINEQFTKKIHSSQGAAKPRRIVPVLPSCALHTSVRPNCSITLIAFWRHGKLFHLSQWICQDVWLSKKGLFLSQIKLYKKWPSFPFRVIADSCVLSTDFDKESGTGDQLSLPGTRLQRRKK